MTVASKSQRDAKLDDLEVAVKEWRDRKKERLETQVTLAKRVLLGRTGAERLNNETVVQATDLLVDEIEEFLTGGG